MKFGFLSEADPRPGQTYAQRYRDLEDEVLLAERVGFDVFGVSEQHFAIAVASVSAPECVFSYLFAKTSRIRFRHAITLLPYLINHPLRVAERIATEDVLSNGRVELGTGRGNTTLTLKAFGVSPEENKAQSEEALDLIITAMTQDPFEFNGRYFQVPRRSLVPKVIQRPHPPIWSAAMSPDSIRQAGRRGIGAWASASDRGWGYLEEAVAIYREGIAEARESGRHVNNSVAAVVTAHCAEDRDQALRESRHALIDMRRMATQAYGKLARMSSDYAYMREIAEINAEKGADIDYMLHESASLIIGDPDDFIRQLERFREIGVDEVWMRIDSLPHPLLMRSIELIGRYVLPHFREPWNVVEDPEAVRSRILAAREERERNQATGDDPPATAI